MAIHRNIICVMLSCAVTLLGATVASAHAELKQAEPAVDGTVAAAPTDVTLHFSERLEPALSTIVVRTAVGKRVDKADAKVDQKDRTVIRASLQSLTPGTYIVEWRALTADTHRTEGAFIFRVGE
jgi:methionine-rich copper-binding protein CopC